MNAAELEHLCKTLITAVAEARAMVRYGDNSADYADVVKHAHDMAGTARVERWVLF